MDPSNESKYDGFPVGKARVMSQANVQPGTGDGFILALFGTEVTSDTSWKLSEEGEEYPVNQAVDLPAGTYNVSFHSLGDVHTPKPLLGVVVQPGVGSVIIVDFDDPVPGSPVEIPSTVV